MRVFDFGWIGSKNLWTDNIISNLFNAYFRYFNIDWGSKCSFNKIKFQTGYYEIIKLRLTVSSSIGDCKLFLITWYVCIYSLRAINFLGQGKPPTNHENSICVFFYFWIYMKFIYVKKLISYVLSRSSSMRSWHRIKAKTVIF